MEEVACFLRCCKFTYPCQDWAPHMTYKVVCLALEVGKHEFDHFESVNFLEIVVT